jgi:hypothetical protein
MEDGRKTILKLDGEYRKKHNVKEPFLNTNATKAAGSLLPKE